MAHPIVRKGQKYKFKVRAVNTKGYGEFSEPVQFTVRNPVAALAPPVPARGEGTNCGAGLVGDDAEVHIKWAAPVDNGGSPVTGYQLYMDDGAGGSYVANMIAGSLEQQQVEVDLTAAGDVTLTFGGQNSDVLSFDPAAAGDKFPTAAAFAAAVEKMLKAADSAGADQYVKVTYVLNDSKHKYLVTFFSQFGNIPTMTSATTNSLTVSVAEVGVGGVGTPEVQRVVLGSSTAADTVSGTFELKLGDLESGAINYGASAADVKTKLDAAFATTARPDVQVEVLASTSGTSQAAYVIAFTRGRPGALPLMALKTTLTGVTSGSQVSAVTRVRQGALEHRVGGPTENRRFRVYVVASNKVGTGRRSPILSIISADLPDWPTDPTEGMTPWVTSVEPDAIGMQWGMPKIQHIGCSP